MDLGSDTFRTECLQWKSQNVNESLNDVNKWQIHKDISTLSVDSSIINCNTLVVTPSPESRIHRDVKYVFNNWGDSDHSFPDTPPPQHKTRYNASIHSDNCMKCDVTYNKQLWKVINSKVTASLTVIILFSVTSVLMPSNSRSLTFSTITVLLFLK